MTGDRSRIIQPSRAVAPPWGFRRCAEHAAANLPEDEGLRLRPRELTKRHRLSNIAHGRAERLDAARIIRDVTPLDPAVARVRPAVPG